MKELSAIAGAVRASTTLAIDSLYKKMKAEGVDVIGFAAGEPDFNTPEHIKAAAIAAIDANFTRYTPPGGIEPLRKAVCARLKADCGTEYTPDQIVVASGAKHNVFVALMALLNPGDEVLLPAPYWVSYYELIRMAGGVPVVVDATEEEGFRVSADRLEAAVSEKTKAMILNNPSNPTGMVYGEAELAEIARVCVKHDIYIIADEIYYKLVYGGERFTSVAALGEEVRARTILINGVSKTYAMTGWRIGYSASSTSLAKVMTDYLSHSTSAPSSISQMAALEALGGPQDSVEQMHAEFERRRDYMVRRINGMDGVHCLLPGGAFYVMMNIRDLIGKTVCGVPIRDADSFADVFLREGLVCLVPGTGFGAPLHLRWSYAASMEHIREGMDRLERFLICVK